jgi:hypothetical protein
MLCSHDGRTARDDLLVRHVAQMPERQENGSSRPARSAASSTEASVGAIEKAAAPTVHEHRNRGEDVPLVGLGRLDAGGARLTSPPCQLGAAATRACGRGRGESRSMRTGARGVQEL